MAIRPWIRSRRFVLAVVLGGSILVVGVAWGMELRRREDRALDTAVQAALAAVVSDIRQSCCASITNFGAVGFASVWSVALSMNFGGLRSGSFNGLSYLPDGLTFIF